MSADLAGQALGWRAFHALELGRPVTIADVAAHHPGKPDRCLCRGKVELQVLNRPGQNICQRALDAFRKACGVRVQDTPRGPRWKIGMSPEEWGFRQMFAAEIRDFTWRESFRKTVGTIRPVFP